MSLDKKKFQCTHHQWTAVHSLSNSPVAKLDKHSSVIVQIKVFAHYVLIVTEAMVA